jgi:hypothetical protein
VATAALIIGLLRGKTGGRKPAEERTITPPLS